MPVLPISDGHGNLRQHSHLSALSLRRASLPAGFGAFAKIWTLTHLPDEADLPETETIVAARTALASKRDLSGASVSLGSVERILNDEQDIAHRLIAFYIMSVNLACSAHHPELVGYRRAGLSLGKGLTTIKKAWRRFSPVAHLLVAPSYCPHDGEQAPDEWLLEMLAYAEEIRRRGESIYPHGQQVQGRPLLDPERTWTCPEDLMLPPAELQIEPLSEGVLAALKGVGR